MTSDAFVTIEVLSTEKGTLVDEATELLPPGRILTEVECLTFLGSFDCSPG